MTHRNIWLSWGVIFEGFGENKKNQTPCRLRLGSYLLLCPWVSASDLSTGPWAEALPPPYHRERPDFSLSCRRWRHPICRWSLWLLHWVKIKKRIVENKKELIKLTGSKRVIVKIVMEFSHLEVFSGNSQITRKAGRVLSYRFFFHLTISATTCWQK